ncbi:hypothetical protein [Streptomyces ureilyticus]|uniref:Transposase (putative) YhgA-like domain-containing protein n=1 Tax=Streptomyces ureilyticus TaxID=1775131 RepID=A0ABX0E7U8_9ACTN|nr:hypothetical protein [Streptomyces ureilyticus]NGO49190.1 hypothetical protein [Streptomyces ureilyticus]
MIGSSHEALHRIFQKDPGLLTRACQRLLHIPFPEPREIAVLNADLTEIQPIERRVDTLLRVDTDDGDYLLVIESQGKKNEAKRGSWAYYLSYLYEKYRCEPVLLVVTQCSSTARWAAQPIRFGLPGWSSLTVRPIVLGPDNVPVIADEREAERDIPLAVFSAMTHGKGPGAAAILEPLAAALGGGVIDTETAAVFAELIESGLVDPQAKKIWRDLMTSVNYFFRNPVAQQLRVEERTTMILRIMESRGLEVPDSVRERVLACTDLDRLEAWVTRAVHATAAADLFDDED